MEINDVLYVAAKYQELTDFLNDSLKLREYKADVANCAKQKISSFKGSYEKFTSRLNENERIVNVKNKDRLEMLAGIIDIGFEIFSIIKLRENNTHIFKACYGILVNSLKIVQEIFCLCSNGFSDGAFARWRSLFENYIVAKILIESDEETSEMFLGYETIIKQKRINEFNKISNENTIIFISQYNTLIDKYGEDYSGFNGWLIKKFPNIKDRSFNKLAEYVNCKEWLFFYRIASDYLHSNAFSAFESTGKGDNMQIPMGPSDNGIEFPINLTITIIVYLLTKLVEKFQGKNFMGLFLMDYLLKILSMVDANK